jgi:hypothetical protein
VTSAAAPKGFLRRFNFRTVNKASNCPAVPRHSDELLDFLVRDICKNIDDMKGGVNRPSWFL